MEAVQKRESRSLEESKTIHEVKRRPIIEINEITLREIKIYSEVEGINFLELIKSLVKTKE